MGNVGAYAILGVFLFFGLWWLRSILVVIHDWVRESDVAPACGLAAAAYSLLVDDQVVNTLVGFLGGGLVGGVATTWMTTNHERQEADRARAVAGADDFLKAFGDARTALLNLGATGGSFRDALKDQPQTVYAGSPEWERYADQSVEFDAAADKGIDAAYAASARLSILFSEDSGVWDLARRACRASRDWEVAALEATPSQKTPRPSQAALDLEQNMNDAAGELERQFHAAVRAVVIKPPALDRLRRLRPW